MRLNTAVERYLACQRYVRGLAPTTLKLYTAHLERFQRFTGRETPLARALERAEKYLAALGRDGVGEHYRRKAYVVLLLLEAHHFERGRLKRRPMVDVACPKVKRAQPRFLAHADVRVSLRRLAASGGMHSERNAVLAGMLYYCLLRVSEACRLKPEDVDLERQTVRVLGKGDTDMLVPIPDAFMPMLRAWLRVRPKDSPFLFPSRPLHAVRCGQLDSNRVQKVIRRLGLPRVTPHTFRRSSANELNKRRVPLKTIQGLLRHSREQTTRLYVCGDVESLREGAKQLND